MPAPREHDDSREAPDGRWQRRALRRAAERRRIPKHGKAYVNLVERMLAERAQTASPPRSTRADEPTKHRGPGPASKQRAAG